MGTEDPGFFAFNFVTSYMDIDKQKNYKFGLCIRLSEALTLIWKASKPCVTFIYRGYLISIHVGRI